MRVLFDQGPPVPLRRHLDGHEVSTARECGWAELCNGALLAAAEAAGFDPLLTTDQNLRDQQRPEGGRLAIVVLTPTSWPRIRCCLGAVVDALAEVQPGDYLEVEIAWG